MLIDSHCHLQDPKFKQDLEAVITRACESGVIAMVTIGYDMPSTRRGIEIAEARDGVYATIGVHPHDAKTVTETDLGELRMLADSDRVVGIGEIGFDFFRNLSPRVDQERAFRDQLELARDLRLPVVIHSREADEDTFAVLEQYEFECRSVWPKDRPLGVMHCYAGNLGLAFRYINLGFMISVSATVTYPAAQHTREVAAGVPISWLAVETDAPYLPPQTARGQRNEPARVRDVAEYVANLRGIPYDELAEATAHNTQRLFKLGTAH